MAERKVVSHESAVPYLRSVGIVGGMGQWATLDILERLLQASVSFPIPQYGNRGYPEINVTMLNKAPMLLNVDGSYPETLTASPELLAAAKYIGEQSDLLIVTSHTAHLFADEIERAAGKTLVSMVAVTVDEVKRRGIKNVGVLAIGLTVDKKLFQFPLEALGINCFVLPKDLERRLEDEGIYPVQEGDLASAHSAVALEAVANLRQQGAEAVILGCTEIPLLLGAEVKADYIINPSELIAREVIRRAVQ